jgi:nicotinamidase-related amidase
VDHTNAGDRQFFSQRGFGVRLGFGERPALLVVDFINAFTDSEMPLGANVDAEIAQTNLLLDAAHAARIPVYFTREEFAEPDLGDAGIPALNQKGVATLRAGTPAVELDARLHRAPDDGVLVKKFASAFFSTDLASRLQFRRIDTLIVAGCTTSGCVRATVVDACQHGFRAVVAEEAVGDRSRAAHAQSLFDIDAKYGDVRKVADILDYLRVASRSRPSP